MNKATKRAIRTFFQAFLGSIITSGVLSATSESGVVDWSALHKVAVAAGAAGIIALITFIQNALEDSGTIPALLKQPNNTLGNDGV